MGIAIYDFKSVWFFSTYRFPLETFVWEDNVHNLGTHCRLETRTIQPRTLNCPTRLWLLTCPKLAKLRHLQSGFWKKQAFRLLDVTSGRALSLLGYPMQTGKRINSISTRRIHTFWTAQLTQTSPNHRVCFKKILLEETFGADLSQTGKAETFFKNSNSSPSISGRKTSAIQTVRILENFRIFGPVEL